MITIPIPEGLEIPASAQENGTMEAQVEFTVDVEGGTLTIISIDGVDMEMDEAPEEEAAAAPEDESIAAFVASQTGAQR